MREIRTVSYLLHPPILDELGLEGVLRWYAQGFSGRSGIEVRTHIRECRGRMPYEVELALFRIVQEALTNVHRHSGSPTADITLVREDSSVILEITDQGKGVPAPVLEATPETMATLGVGIAGMRERVRQLQGTLSITASSKGTTIRVVLPLPPDPAAS
jgi:signal transduction histidine kinase